MTIDRTIWPSEIVIAREMLSAGVSLKKAADEIGVMSGELDLALWQNLDVTNEELRKTVSRRPYAPDF